MEDSSEQHRRSLAAATLSWLALVAAWSLGVVAPNAAARAPASSLGRCDATLARYRPDPGVQAGLAQLPWIAASPAATGLVGHLFYYDRSNAWKRKRLPKLRMYSGGQSPDGRISMKILWELRRGSATLLGIRGTRLDGAGAFTVKLSATSSNSKQFPSIIDVPGPGCWRLTLKAGTTTGRVAVLVVPGKTR
jgi:hypothetical protein